MSDIFISYDHSDIKVAEALVQALEGYGWTVWWDRHIRPGKTFDEVIEAELDASRCVVVLWSNASASSNWVKTEAAEGNQRSVLVPAMIENAKIPLAFRRIQAADLTDWKENKSDPGFTDLVNAIVAILNRPPRGQRSEATAEVFGDEVEQIRVPASRRPDRTLEFRTESQKLTKAATFNRSIVIHIPDPTTIEKKRIPDDAVVEADPGILGIFGLSHGHWKWMDLKTNASEQSSTRWLDELARAVYRASQGLVFYPIESMYRSAEGQVYRPILYQSQTFKDGSITFHILFVESRVIPADTPQDLVILQSLLVQGTRFRYEIVEKYLVRSIAPLASSEINEFCDQLRKSILDLEGMASLPLITPEQLYGSFSSPKDRDEILRIFEIYSMKREHLFFMIEARDINGIRSSLRELLEIAKKLMIVASRRHSKLIYELMA